MKNIFVKLYSSYITIKYEIIEYNNYSQDIMIYFTYQV